jgi:hypothetical protein
LAGFATYMLITVAILGASGCSTTPKAEDRETFSSEARAATKWFERNVSGLREQIDGAAGYIVFPGVAQWGIIFGGGDFGRGMLCRPDGTQIGWAAINTPSIGLQAGVRGFKRTSSGQTSFRDRSPGSSWSGKPATAAGHRSTTASPSTRGRALA